MFDSTNFGRIPEKDIFGSEFTVLDTVKIIPVEKFQGSDNVPYVRYLNEKTGEFGEYPCITGVGLYLSDKIGEEILVEFLEALNGITMLSLQPQVFILEHKN